MVHRIAVGAALAVILLAIAIVAAAPQRPLESQPFPDSHEYADAARRLANGEGYVTLVHGSEPQPPRYPPGYSLILTPFAAVGEYPTNVQTGTKVLAVGYVLAAVLLAWSLGGPLAALFAAVVLSVSPFARESAGVVLSDALVATITVLSLLLLRRNTRVGATLSGSLAGFVVVVRLAGIVNLLALVLAAPMRRRLVAAAVPPLIGLALLQWVMFGDPLRTGYDYWQVSEGAFQLSNATREPPHGDGKFIFTDRLDGRLMNWTCPCPHGDPMSTNANVLFYPAVLLGFFWIYAPPLFTVFGLAFAWIRRQEMVCRFTLAFTALTLVLFVFYFYQGARFMAAPATLLVILACVALAELACGGVGRLAATSRALRRNGKV